MIDIKTIQEDVESILTYSQAYPFELDCTNLLRQWQENKEFFLSLFGNRLSIRSEQPVKIILSEEQQIRRFNDFISTLDTDKILTDELEKFLRENEKGFFVNKVLKDYPEKGIQAGAKISKSFKRFLSDKETTRYIQDIASRFIQENKIEGYLYLSVDPRDFLTLSENNEHWWSCQALDGDFRAGNLNYMTDSTTIVAYLASEKQEQLRCFPPDKKWNSKKWRMLIHTDGENIIYYNRQYPYDSTNLLNQVHSFITHLLGLKNFKMFPLGFKTPIYPKTTTNQLCAGGRVFDSRDIVNADNYLGYCDLIYSHNYVPIVAVDNDRLLWYSKRFSLKDRGLSNELVEFYGLFGIQVGNKSICPCCGESYIEKDNSFLCPFCIAEHDAEEDFFLICDSCLHRIYDEEEVYWINDLPYCKECYKELCKIKGEKLDG